MLNQTQPNYLNELGYKIFLDRYALKDGTRASLAVGDVVVVVINEQTGQREIGKVVSIQLPKVTVELLEGERVERDLEHVDKPLETRPEEMMDRVAWGVAQIELDPEQQSKWQEHFRWLLDDWKFVPGGRILTAAGTDQELTYYNCFVIDLPKDSREGIIRTLGQMTEIMSRGGGVGINISSLRPRHAYVKGVNGRSSGSVSWGALYSFVTGLIEQGGCFSPDTRIATDKGLIPTSELADRMDAGEIFYAQTHKGLRRITARFRNGVKPLYQLTTKLGYQVKITEDHKVAVLVDGQITTIPLKQLQQGDEVLLLLGESASSEVATSLETIDYNRSIMSTNRIDEIQHTMPDTIQSIVPVGESEVFDFEVDEVHLLSGNGIYTSNSRRGALMLILNDWHPDVFDFINSKRKAGQITNANISVGVSNKLMEAIKQDGDWQLLFPDTSDPDYDTVWAGDLDAWQASGRKVIHYKTVKAREVWNAIIESAWASAEPGVWFRERSNEMSNSWYFNPLIATNPCGEQPLGAFSVCNLGAINLARFYDEAKHDVKWDDLRQAVRFAIRFLDNVIDTTPYFFEENRRVQAQGERRVGLGTMGIAELMVKLKVRYGSDESVELIDRLYHLMARESYLMSSEIAKEKGSFHPFDAEQFLESGFMHQMDDDVRESIRVNGIRNVTLLTQAPTGTTGTMVNTSTGIEPFFSWSYYRKSRLGLHEEKVPLVAEYYAQHPEATTLPDYFITAMELSPRDHVRVQGAFQRWIDSAISKTCNVPNDYTVQQVAELYEYMYDLGCKGGTIYRDGRRDEQVLMLKKDEPQPTPTKPEAEAVKPAEQVATPHRVYPRPGKLRGTTVNTVTPFGRAYITMNDDEKGNPFEVFITAPGKAGSDLQADAEGLGRMISLSLRTTAPSNRKPMLKLIIDQLRDIGGTRSVGFGPNRVSSLPDAVARALEENYFASAVVEQLMLPMTAEPSSMIVEQSNPLSGADLCPTCASVALVRVEGCRKCLACGYSEC